MPETSGPLTVIPQSVEAIPAAFCKACWTPKFGLEWLRRLGNEWDRTGGFPEARVLEHCKCSVPSDRGNSMSQKVIEPSNPTESVL